MAETGAEMDPKAHEATYSGFIGLMKWGTVAAVAVTAGVVVLIAS